jgi:hypothetical protein
MTPKLKPGHYALDPQNRRVYIVKVVGDEATVRLTTGQTVRLPASVLRPAEGDANSLGREKITPVPVNQNAFTRGIYEDQEKFRSKKAAGDDGRKIAILLSHLAEVRNQIAEAHAQSKALLRDIDGLKADLRKSADEKGVRFFASELSMAVEAIWYQLEGAQLASKEEGQRAFEHLHNLDNLLSKGQPVLLPVSEWERQGGMIFGIGDILDGGTNQRVWENTADALRLTPDRKEGHGQDFQVWRIPQIGNHAVAVTSHKGRGIEVVIGSAEDSVAARIRTLWMTRIENELRKQFAAAAR